jgi:hypothetical protein
MKRLLDFLILKVQHTFSHRVMNPINSVRNPSIDKEDIENAVSFSKKSHTKSEIVLGTRFDCS